MWVGEFGWLAAVAVFVVGVVAALWHLRTRATVDTRSEVSAPEEVPR